MEVHRYFLRQKCSPKNLVFSDILFMAIFAEVTENGCIIERHLRDPCQKAVIYDQYVASLDCKHCCTNANVFTY